VEARHVAKSADEDRDIHLVIASPRDPAKTLIVEFADVRCDGAVDSLKTDAMRVASEDFIAACGLPTKSRFTELSGTATVTGAGFWDKIHGQRGHAENGLELHPVLRFRSTDCAAG
jgi:hypothetical protein